MAGFVKALYRRQRLAAVSKVAVRVVLGNYHIIFCGKPCYGLPSFKPKRLAGRVLECRYAVEKLRPVLFYKLLKLVCHYSLVVRRYAHKLRPGNVERLQHAKERRRLNKHPVPPVNKNSAYKVHALYGAGGRQYAAFVRDYPLGL